MKDNPPAEADAPMVGKMAKIGIAPGQDFDINQLGPDVAKALQSVPKPAFDKSWAITMRRAPSRTAGSSRPRLAFTARIISSGDNHRDRPRLQPAAGCR